MKIYVQSPWKYYPDLEEGGFDLPLEVINAFRVVVSAQLLQQTLPGNELRLVPLVYEPDLVRRPCVEIERRRRAFQSPQRLFLNIPDAADYSGLPQSHIPVADEGKQAGGTPHWIGLADSTE